MNEPTDIPQYLSIADELRAKLRKMPIGAPVDPEQMLAAEYGVSRDTMRRALNVLVHEGLLTRARGRGTFRSQSKTPEFHLVLEESLFHSIRRVGNSSEVEKLSVSLVSAPAEIADMLDIPRGTKVRRVSRARILNGRPYACCIAYMRTDMVPQFFKRDFKTSLSALITDTLHLHIESRSMECYASTADPTAAEILSIPEGSPVMCINIFLRGYNGVPMLVDTFSFPPSQILRFTVTNSKYWRDPID